MSAKCGALTRFARGLRQAIHDLDHESISNTRGALAASDCGCPARGTLVHYWDTDCLYWPAMGYRGYRSNGTRGASARRTDQGYDPLVQALFSAGFLGRVALIGPHENEFARIIKSYVERQVESVDDRNYLRRFVRERGLDCLMGDFASAVSLSLAGDETGLRDAVKQLSRLDSTAFVDVESLRGTWADRLSRLLRENGLLLSSVQTLSVREIREDSLFHRFVEALGVERRSADPLTSTDSEGRDNRALQTATDAAALTAVAILNKRGGLFPRFYTSSPSIRRVFTKHEWARDAFSFEFTTKRGQHAKDTVLRDGYYYFLRATLPALRRKDSVRAVGPVAPGLQELRDLSRYLNEALPAGEDELRHATSEWHFSDGATAADVIETIEGSAMSLVWLQYEIEPLILDVVEGARAVVEISDYGDSESIAFELLAQAEHTLRNNMSDLALQVSLTQAVQKRARRVRVDAGGCLKFNPDLAAAVWGLSCDGSPEIGVQGRELSDLLRFQDIPALRESPAEADRAMAIAVGLECFPLAERLAQALSAGSRRVSESTWIMGFVSRIRSTPTIQVRTERDTLQSAWSQLSSDEKQKLCLAYCEASFRLWQRGRFAAAGLGDGAPIGVVERWPDDPLGIALWGLERVLEFLGSLDGQRRKFALGLIFRTVKTLRLDDYQKPEHLKEVEEHPRDNGHRRLAMIGYSIYLDAVRSLPAHGGTPQSVEDAERIRTALEEASALLNEALASAPRDSDTLAYRCSLRSALEANAKVRQTY